MRSAREREGDRWELTAILSDRSEPRMRKSNGGQGPDTILQISLRIWYYKHYPLWLSANASKCNDR